MYKDRVSMNERVVYFAIETCQIIIFYPYRHNNNNNNNCYCAIMRRGNNIVKRPNYNSL